jgi:hypothetical protein
VSTRWPVDAWPRGWALGFRLAIATVVTFRARAAFGAATLALSGSVASAQPPGLVPSTGHLPTHHAVAPAPELFPSPMPTVPPPSRNAPYEPTIGFAINSLGFTAVVSPDGSIDFGEGRAGFWAGADPVTGLVALVTFDVTSDPYVSQKLQVMESTREERWEMRRAHDVVVMQRALDDLPRYLDAVWMQRSWSAAARRQLLFALWDEAAEDGNELLRAGGAEARRIIEAFVADRLPPGTRYAFRAEELARLNRVRQSRQRFDPYRPAPIEDPESPSIADPESGPGADPEPAPGAEPTEAPDPEPAPGPTPIAPELVAALRAF